MCELKKMDAMIQANVTRPGWQSSIISPLGKEQTLNGKAHLTKDASLVLLPWAQVLIPPSSEIPLANRSFAFAESGCADLPGVPGVHSGLTPHLLGDDLQFWTGAEWFSICIQHRLLAKLCWPANLHLLPPPTAEGYWQGNMGGLVILIPSFCNPPLSESARGG